MTKKQKNRKLVSQNIRNRVLNRRYSSLIKFFFKTLKMKLLAFKKKNEIEPKEKLEIFELSKRLESVLDKSVKRNVTHKNTSSRKKYQIQSLLKCLL